MRLRIVPREELTWQCHAESLDAQEVLYRLVETARERRITVRNGSHGEVLSLKYAPLGMVHSAVMVCKCWWQP